MEVNSIAYYILNFLGDYMNSIAVIIIICLFCAYLFCVNLLLSKKWILYIDIMLYILKFDIDIRKFRKENNIKIYELYGFIFTNKRLTEILKNINNYANKLGDDEDGERDNL